MHFGNRTIGLCSFQGKLSSGKWHTADSSKREKGYIYSVYLVISFFLVSSCKSMYLKMFIMNKRKHCVLVLFFPDH